VAEGEDADPNDFAALDAQWEEEAVTFGPGAAPSCKDRIVSQIRAGRRPAAGVPKGVVP
jgi:nitrate reductase delta subunit